jgi:hypothetical protein
LSDAIYLSKFFQDVLVLDRVFNTSYESEESIRITSLINEALAVDLVDMEEEEMMLQVNFTSVPVIKPYVTGLLDFMYVLHGLIQENKSLKSLEAWLKNKNEK